MTFAAVLPAGGRVGRRHAREAGVSVKALMEFRGDTILARTIRALRETGRVTRIVVVGPADLRDHPAAREADEVLPEAASGPENMLRGIEWLGEARDDQSERTLIVTTDLPFLTADAISDFADLCPADADLCVPVVRRIEFERRFPGSPTRFFRLADGRCALGCAFLVNPEALRRNQPYLERVFASRKNPFAMAAMLGLPFILRFIIGSLRVADVEARCRHLLGCTGRAVWDVAPELAYDIDTLADFRYAAALFAGAEGEGERRDDCE